MKWFWQRDDKPVPDQPFRPDPLDPAPMRRLLEKAVDELLPAAVDEATPDVLDGLVDRYTEVQLARLIKAWAEYQHELMPDLVDAHAELAYEQVMYEADERDLLELRLAREAAHARLRGRDDIPRHTEE
ncbi:hypothetical protein [Catellatospora sp. NPDC049609]|uniref:hypothetical protein n=1 Tax=Catellatospora sp. NPDC049609 TaxID=3155505 RepID=UPI00344A9F92